MEELIKKIRAFRDARNWKPYHTPENLAKSIVIEAAELLENYQWTADANSITNVKEELADVMIYCLMLMDHYQFDLETIILEKIEKNSVKYPMPKNNGEK
jgi:dCTP diphosphatase